MILDSATYRDLFPADTVANAWHATRSLNDAGVQHGTTGGLSGVVNFYYLTFIPTPGNVNEVALTEAHRGAMVLNPRTGTACFAYSDLADDSEARDEALDAALSAAKLAA